MTRPRFDSDGVHTLDDPTPELPAAMPGIVEPHAILSAVEWQDGWVDRATSEYVAVSPRSSESDEFLAIDIADLDPEWDERRKPEAAAPPPAPAAAFERMRGAPKSGERRVAQPPERDEAAHAGTHNGVQKNGAAGPAVVRSTATPIPNTRSVGRNPDAGDDLMSELLANEEDGPRRTTERWWAEIFDATSLRLLPNSFYRRTLREADFLERTLQPPAGGRILDLACGYGRHAVELAGRGYRLVGVDIGRFRLEKALAEADRRGLDIHFLLGDMREISMEAEFDGAYCWNTSFGYFDDATNVRVLRSLANALKPGARLVIEQVSRDHVLRGCPRRLWWERDELVVMEDITFSHRDSRLMMERSIVDGQQRPWEQRFDIRLYAPHELKAMCEHVGLTFESLSGDIAHPGLYLGPENRSIIVSARKPE